MRTYLEKYRLSAKKTQQDVAQVLGITSQYYQMIESGSRQKDMDITLAAKIADVFGVPLQEVFEKELEYKNASLNPPQP